MICFIVDFYTKWCILHKLWNCHVLYPVGYNHFFGSDECKWMNEWVMNRWPKSLWMTTDQWTPIVQIINMCGAKTPYHQAHCLIEHRYKFYFPNSTTVKLYPCALQPKYVQPISLCIIIILCWKEVLTPPGKLQSGYLWFEQQ